MKQNIAPGEALSVKEREKLEGLIAEEVEAFVKLYERDRDDGKKDIRRKLEENPGKERLAAVKAFDEAAKKCKELGYQFRDYNCGDDVQAVYEVEKHADLEAFDRTTKSVVMKLRAVKRDYVLRLYTGSGLESLISEMVAELMKVVQETDRKTCPEPRCPDLVLNWCMLRISSLD